MIYLTTNTIHIEDCWMVRHEDFKDFLLRFKDSDCEVFSRSMWSIEREWAASNVLYKMGFFSFRNVELTIRPNVLKVIFGALVYPFA